MPDVHVLTTAAPSPELSSAIRHLLIEAFEGDFAQEDWEHTIGGWHVVVGDGNAILSHAAVVPRVLEVADHPLYTGYVEGVGTTPARQREGLGSVAMAGASDLIRSRFDMGALSTGHQGFYAALGWEKWLGPTYVRRGSETVRTEEEDDGVMVLRFGSSKDVDLTAPISCESRRGDDW